MNNPFDVLFAFGRAILWCLATLFALVVILALVSIATAAPAHAQLWVPVQGAHTGNWYDPDASVTGEGLMPSVQVLADERPYFFAGVYLRDGDHMRVWFAEGDTGDAWSMFGYQFELYRHTAAGVHRAGWLMLTPKNDDGRALDWVVDAVDVDGAVFERAGRLRQLLAPVDGYGWCGTPVSYPRPPAADLAWCHR